MFSYSTQRPALVLALGLFVFLGGLAPTVSASSFLGRFQPHDAVAGLTAETENALMYELEAALGSGHRHATERRLQHIERRLTPMFGAMRKNENGKLGPSAAGYMLHRLFVQRHGWFIRALEPAGKSMGAWNTSTPTSVLQERVPEHVTNSFEKRLGQHGLGIKELAILAATLEHLVHSESLDRLKVAYRASKFKFDAELAEANAIKTLEMYMSMYILSHIAGNLTTMPLQRAVKIHANILQVYPAWAENQEFLKEVYTSVAPKRDYVYFNEMETVIAEVGERYGRFQDKECRELKDWLVEKEDPSVGGAGRVRVADFYNMALKEDRWQFSESVEYLRQLGALDESDASNPRVIIPNYISGPSNCLASSAFYSVCCIDECESILGRLEETIAAPEAAPATITTIVAAIPSATMPTNRRLSPWLHQRLDEVAKRHGGLVPLHGRLFQQWLHYAYPRECHFPHISGTTNPRRAADVVKEDNITDTSYLTANKTRMERVVAAAPSLERRDPGLQTCADEESGMWSMHEELVVWSEPAEPAIFRQFGYVRGFAMVGAAVSLSVALVKNFQPALSSPKGTSDKHFV